MSDEGKLYREIHPVIKTPDGETGPILEFRSSDETLDRYREVILASGWQLANYLKNPVVQNAHKYGDIIHTIGRSIVTEVRGTELYQKCEFAVDVNPLAKIAYGLYKGGFLNAVSVGFIPISYENGTKQTPYDRKYTKQDLLEVSAVGIPANPNALKLGFEAGAIEKSDLKELAALLKHFCSENAGSGSHAPAPGTGADGAGLLQILNEVRSILPRT